MLRRIAVPIVVAALAVANALAGEADARERAAALSREGRHAEAAEVWSEALAAFPDDVEAIAGRVRALIASDSWREALDEARTFVAARPGVPEIEAILGEALFRAGRIEEAGRRVEPLVLEASPPPRSLVVLGNVRAAQGRDEEAAALLNRALDAAPEDRWVRYQTAWAADSRAEVVKRLERYLEIAEGDDPDRIEGARGTVRLFAALGERPVWIPAQRPKRLEMPLRPLPGRGGKVAGWIVDAKFGGKKTIPLLLDTGSSGLFVVERTLKKTGFDPLAEQTVFAGGGRGRSPTRRGILPAFSIGDLSFRDALVTATTQELEPTGRYRGLLGLAAFDGYRVTLDLGKGRLVLEPPVGDPAGSPYWTLSGQLLVEAQTGGSEPGLFLFDTGAATTLVSTGLVTSLPETELGPASSVVTFGGAVEGARVARGVRLSFSGLDSAGGPMNAADLSQRSRLGGIEISGYLGLDLLGGSTIVVDTKARRIEARVAP